MQNSLPLLVRLLAPRLLSRWGQCHLWWIGRPWVPCPPRLDVGFALGSRLGHSPPSAKGLTSDQPQRQEGEWQLSAQLCPAFSSLCGPQPVPAWPGSWQSVVGEDSTATCLWPPVGSSRGSDHAASLYSCRPAGSSLLGAPVDVKMTLPLPSLLRWSPASGLCSLSSPVCLSFCGLLPHSFAQHLHRGSSFPHPEENCCSESFFRTCACMFQKIGQGFLWSLSRGAATLGLSVSPCLSPPLFSSAPLSRALCLPSWLWSPHQPSVQRGVPLGGVGAGPSQRNRCSS